MNLHLVALWALQSCVPHPAGDIEAELQRLYDTERFAEAATLAENACPATARVRLYQGLAFARLNRWDEAERALMLGRDLAPNDVRFSTELAGVAYRQGRISVAKKRLTSALRLDPGQAYANDFLGTLYMLEGNVAAALEYWNRIGKPVIHEVKLTPVVRLDPLLRDRAVLIAPGQVLRAEQLRWTRSHLDRLNVFAAWRVDLAAVGSGRFAATVATVPRRQLAAGWLGRIIPLARGLPYQAVHIDRHNIGERAWNFDSIWRWDPDKRRIAAVLQAPWRLDPGSQVRALVDVRDEDWDVSTTYRGSAGANELLQLRKQEFGGSFTRALTSKLEWTSGLTLASRSWRTGSTDEIFSNGWSFQWPNSLRYALWSRPQNRLRLDADGTLAPGRVLGAAPSRFLITTAGVSASWRPGASGDTWHAGARVRGGWTAGRIPFDQYFMLGMERDTDLWLRGIVGTRHGRKGSAPMGTEYGLLQTEIRRTVFRLPLLRVEAGPFLDAGNIDDSFGRFGSQGWTTAAGLEIRLMTAGGIGWTLVYGRNLKDGRGVLYTAAWPWIR